MFLTARIVKLLVELRDAVAAILKLLRLRTPGLVWMKVVSEGENGMLKFVLMLPPKGVSDVVQRQLAVKVGSNDLGTVVLEGDIIESNEMQGDDNDVVEGSLIDVDDAGNPSEPRTFSFVLTDTLAPPQPGELGIRVTEES